MTEQEKNCVGTVQSIFEIMYKCDFKSNDGHTMYHVRCIECGWETDMQYRHIKIPRQCKHCVTINNKKYYIGDYRWNNKRLQHIFNGIVTRCYNPEDRAYRWYGKKGIKICEEWLENRFAFEQWALANGYQKGLTIDRIDESKDYCPENCRWITGSDNSKYKSTTKILKVDEEEHTGREWADVLNLGTNTINMLLRKYSKEMVVEFIRRRKQDLTKTRKSHQTWFNVYGLED